MNSSFRLILLGLVAILATRVESLPAVTTKSEILEGTSDSEPGHIINKRYRLSIVGLYKSCMRGVIGDG